MYDPNRQDALTWLQGWYAAHVDGDWEHQSGITIETLDNPGWRIRIDLAHTELESVPFERFELHRSEHDWLVLWIEGRGWEGACGPLNLGEAIHAFRVWVQGHWSDTTPTE